MFCLLTYQTPLIPRAAWTLLIVLSLCPSAGCEGDAHRGGGAGAEFKTRDGVVILSDAQPDSEGLYPDLPQIQPGEIVMESGEPGSADRERAAAVLDLLRELVAMLDREDLSGLPELVSREKGLYVDLKAHQTRDWVIADLRKPTGYIHTHYLNTAGLRQRTEEESQLAVRDILRLTRLLTADVYLQEDGLQCELRLRLEDAPSKSYYLNNPVFIYENDRWLIYRLI